MRQTELSISLAAADTDGICQAQDPASGADLTINGALASGGVATMDVARRVVITSAANDTAVTFTIYGTNRNGIEVTEAVTGSNASTAVSSRDFKTVTRIATSGNAGSVQVGTNGQASSAWIPIDHRKQNISVGFAVGLSSGASLSYSVEHTLTDIQDLATIKTGTIEVRTHSSVAAETTEQDGNYVLPPRAIRLTLNSYTSGTATLQVIQGG